MDTSEVNTEFEGANEAEAEVSLRAGSGRGRHSYKNIQLLFLIGSLFLTVAALWGVARGIKRDMPLPASAMASGSGASYTTVLPETRYWLFESLTDNPGSPHRSQTELFEDDKPLGPAHSTHDAIRSTGSGQFSHWGSTLYFSTSDNSEPRTNGRHYKAVVTATLPFWTVALPLLCLLLSLYLNRRIVSRLWPQPAGGLIENIKAQWETPAESPLFETTPLFGDWRTDKRAALLVILPPLISLLLGITLHALVPTPTPIGDSITYHTIATGLVGQNKEAYYGFHWAIGGLAVRGFIYPIIVAGVYWVLGGASLGAVGWIQAVVMVPLTTFLIYVAGKEAFSRRVGLIASWAFALWFPAVWHTMWLLTEPLLNLMMALVLALLAATLARRNAKLALLCGVTIGLLSAGHSAYQFLPILMVPTILAHLYFYDRKHFWLAGFVLVGVLSIHVPYRIAVITADLPRLGQGAKGYGGGGGWGFYVASRVETDFFPVPDDFQVTDLSARGQLVEVGKKLDRGEIHVEPHLLKIIREKLALPDAMDQTLTDSDYYHAGIQNLLDHPDKWPVKLKLNALGLFSFPDRMLFYGPDPTTATWFRKPWRPLNWSLLGLTLLGFLFALWKRRDRLVLFAPLVFQIILFLAIICVVRYAIPFWSSMFLLAAVGAVGWLEILGAMRSAWSGRHALPQRS